MRVTITDKEALRALSWNAVASYLETAGWQRVNDIPGKSVAYQHTDNNGRLWEILVLLREDLADYASRMADAVSTLARVEDRSELDVYDDLLMLDTVPAVVRLESEGQSHTPESYSSSTSPATPSTTAEKRRWSERVEVPLPERQARILALHNTGKLSMAEIAQIEGIPRNQATVLLHQAQERVRQYLIERVNQRTSDLVWRDADSSLRLS
jgi:hypothetical protein